MHIPGEHPPAVMEPRTNWSGALIAECPDCHLICAYWDEEDLDEDGRLLCYGS